jgi:uncharacterized protein YutE (UPF0331/DUF86 family)
VKDVVERRFEMMTQACLDIARTLLKSLDVEVPEANADTMRRLATAGVIAERTGVEMAEAAGLRNVLAHEYGHVIDDEVVYDALRDLSRYRAFLVDVREYPMDRGRSEPRDGLDELLDAFDRLDTDATLGVIGDGPQRDALERQAQTLDASDRITVTGVLGEHEDVLAQMKAARVFASPS